MTMTKTVNTAFLYFNPIPIVCILRGAKGSKKHIIPMRSHASIRPAATAAASVLESYNSAMSTGMTNLLHLSLDFLLFILNLADLLLPARQHKAKGMVPRSLMHRGAQLLLFLSPFLAITLVTQLWMTSRAQVPALLQNRWLTRGPFGYRPAGLDCSHRCYRQDCHHSNT